MQAIRTKYFPPTNFRGSYIQAKAEAGSIRFPYDYELGVQGNHKAACEKLLAKLGWNYGDMVSGEFGHEHYWVWQFNGQNRRDCLASGPDEGTSILGKQTAPMPIECPHGVRMRGPDRCEKCDKPHEYEGLSSSDRDHEEDLKTR